MHFIKLHLCSNDKVIYINSFHIKCLGENLSTGSWIQLGDEEINVKETPNQILSMC